MEKELMIIVYTTKGHTYTFYDVENISYHGENLSFEYVGFSGKTKAMFHNVAGITKHEGIKNPKKKEK